MIHFLFMLLFAASSAFGAGHAVPWDLITKYVPTDPVILEAGAQFGEDIPHKFQLWPTSTIYAFEPVPAHYQALEALKKKYANLYIFKLALSDKEGTFNMYLADGASSLLQPSDWANRDYFHSDLNQPITVDCTTMKKWAKNQGVRKIDFMWVDIEGMELQVLSASGKLLDTCCVVFVEGNFQQFWKNCTMYTDLRPFLESKGFVEVWHSIQPQWNGNFLFVKKELLD